MKYHDSRGGILHSCYRTNAEMYAIPSYEVISLSKKLSMGERNLCVNFAIPKGTKLAAVLNLVDVKLKGLPGVTQIERDQPDRRPEITSPNLGRNKSKIEMSNLMAA